MNPSPMIRCALLAVTLIAGAPAYAAQARVFGIDPVHTRVAFLVGHAGFSRSIGTVSGASGRIEFDPEDWTSARVEVWLPVDRIDFGDEDWNRRMHGRGFFAAARHPRIHFVSTGVEPMSGHQARIHGELTVAGVRRPVVLEARLNEVGRNPMNFRRSVGFSATATLDRRDFGLSAYPNVIGNAVEVIIEVEAVRGRSAGDEPEPEGFPDEEER